VLVPLETLNLSCHLLALLLCLLLYLLLDFFLLFTLVSQIVLVRQLLKLKQALLLQIIIVFEANGFLDVFIDKVQVDTHFLNLFEGVNRHEAMEDLVKGGPHFILF